MNYKDFFKDKKIAVIGLGPHGEMIADIKFLLRNKARVSLYDMRSERRLKGFILSLPVNGLEKLTFGKVLPDDILSSDLIIISPEISKKSFFLRKAVENGIQIEFPDTLFFKLAPPITLIGVLGSYGKSTIAHMIYSLLKKSFISYEDQGLFFIDPDATNGALTHLKKIKKGDVVLARIPEYLLQYYYEIRISPHVAVITSIIPFKILEFQTHNNFIVAPDEVVDSIKSPTNLSSRIEIRAKILRTRGSMIPSEWGMSMTAIHNRENAALALQASELFKVPTDIAREVIHNFSGLRGHLEFVKKVGGVEFFNDAYSVTPKSTLSALQSLSVNKNIILIMGGAYTPYNYDDLINQISNYVSKVILLPGSGSLGLRQKLENLQDIEFIQAISLEEAVKIARESAKKRECVLFSPGFEAVGMDISRKERAEKFVKLVRSL